MGQVSLDPAGFMRSLGLRSGGWRRNVEMLEDRRLLSASLVTLASFDIDAGSFPGGEVSTDAEGNLAGTTFFGGSQQSAVLGTVFKLVPATKLLAPSASFLGPNGRYSAAGQTPSTETVQSLTIQTLQQQRADAQAQLELASTNLDRVAQLVASNVAPQQELEVATFAAAEAAEALAKIEAALGAAQAPPPASFGLDEKELQTQIGDAEARVAPLQTNRDAAAAGLVRLEALAAAGAVTQSDVESGRRALAIAELDLQNGQVLLRLLRLRLSYVQRSIGVVSDAAGNLYGVTSSGGSTDNGTIFKIPAGTSEVVTLVNFDKTNGARPRSGLTIDAIGNLYGTTSEGGANGAGTAFRLDPATNTFVTLVSFAKNLEGARVNELVMDAAGDLYGSTEFGGKDELGTVFKINVAKGSLSTLASFSGKRGARPTGRLAIDADGKLYGATASGADNDLGGLFQLSTNNPSITLLASFDNSTGQTPTGVISDAAGNLYGTTAFGGPSNRGTVFKFDATSGVLATLVAFDQTDGRLPLNGLFADSSGNLLGTTLRGGADDAGTVYQVSGTDFVLPTVPPVVPPVSPPASPPTSPPPTSPPVVGAPGDPITVISVAKLPATAIAGEKAKGNVTVVIPNPSTTDKFKQSVTVTLLASTDAVLDGGDVTILDKTKKLTIKPGKSGKFKVPFKSFPASLGDGNYQVIAQMVPTTGGTLESITAESTAVAAPFVNLVGTTTGPQTLVTGKKAKVVVQATNEGNVKLSGTAEIQIDAALGGNLNARTQMSAVMNKLNLKPGKTKKVTVSFLVPASLNAGSYNLTATLDSGGVINESNESDNLSVSAIVSTLS